MGAVIVNVEVGDLAASVTDEGERPQVNAGCGPLTEQDSCTTFPEAPLIEAMVTTSVICAPEFTVKLVEAGLSEKPAAVMVYVALPIALCENSAATAIALIVSVAVTVIGPVYFVDDVVGPAPFVV